jgi:hypothetical protein
MQEQQPQMQLDLGNTTAVETPSGKQIFQQGFIIRKASRFVTGTPEDALIPIPVFYDTESGKVLSAALPVEVRELFSEDDLI